VVRVNLAVITSEADTFWSELLIVQLLQGEKALRLFEK